MQHLKAGATVLILNAQWQWHEGKKAQILSATDTKVVVEVHDFFRRETIELAPEQVIALDLIEPTTQGPFHTDDTIFLHEAAYGQARDCGQEGLVISAFPTWQKCLVTLDKEDADGDNWELCDFADISLISPERRLPDEDYLRAVTRAVSRRGYWRKYNEWWQEQAEKKLWPITELPDLYRASLFIKTQVNAEIAAEVERQSHLLMQAFGNLTHTQKVKKWQIEWSSWMEYPTSSNESTPEEKLLKAIFGDDTSSEERKNEGQEVQPETPDWDGQGYSYRNSGPELLERCEKHMNRLDQPEGYAYDTIPFRAIPSEVTVDTPVLISSPPTLPQTAFLPIEPLILPGREQALTLLEDEGEHFIAALARLASDADDTAVATLLEKYEALQTREGFDNMQYHHINSVALALLATQRETAIDAVIKKELDAKIWGNASAYSVQGIMFKGNAQALFWDEENPWHVSTGEEVQTAIARIWASVARYVPRFVALLSEYTCGLALFKHQETGEYYLGYLHLVPFTAYEQNKYSVEPRIPTDTSINHLLDWLNQGDLCLLLGYPPRDPDNDGVEHLPNFRLPLALREMYAIHCGLDGAGGHNVDSPQRVRQHLSWIDEKQNDLLDRFHARNLGLLPDQFVAFAPDAFGNTYVFDLDNLDERHDPQVADWDHETWEVSKREPFWQWFADFAPRSLLGLNKENMASNTDK